MILLMEHAVKILQMSQHGLRIKLTACLVFAACCCNLSQYVTKFSSILRMARSSCIMSHFTPCADSMFIYLHMLLGSEHAVAKQDMVPS
jgi:hypothetical protein